MCHMWGITEIKGFRKEVMDVRGWTIWKKRLRRRIGGDEGAPTAPMSQISGRRDPCRSPMILFWATCASGKEQKTGRRGRSGEMAGPRSPFHQMPPLTRVDFGRGAKTTGRGSVDRTKRSQAFSIQSLGQKSRANCMSKRRIIRHTTYLS